MLVPERVPPVAPDEQVARFVLFSRHFRSSDHTVKPDAFIPHPHADLSVMRHLQAAEDEIWQEGRRVATARDVSLYGRADVSVTTFRAQSVDVVAAPIPENPNHANAVGWANEKAEQKLKAIEIALKATYRPRPR